ncbi:FUSC family protein [Paraburkholderia humisilvae]|uniref:p-hydroxybenzoic acid efflux pump subunit AaeB n=1 Tax=Paraburkholderia humisilvae TaxID=627669 RepID=A0A6J5DAQ6_9BURK|nr:FUSC family protein [Paraburkholderia humisilvae]CAB3751013.1 p-hydroxybenzoic acid efflux pump subunit AaeB [Paraburkholderia humisilvae]
MRSISPSSRRLLTFSGRTALAATLALLCAILLGLHEPHWAAWTVVSVGNAARGDGLLKSFYRAIGTAVGAPAGVLLVFAAHGSEPWLIGLLAAWLAVCVYAGVASRNYRAYATVLAGYSAVIVAMSVSGDSGQLFEMGADRCLAILIGIASALLVLLLSRDAQSGHANRRLRVAIAAACDWCADRLAGLPRAKAGDGSGPQRLRGQLNDILALDGAVHSAAAESPALWTRARPLHGVVSALVELLVVSRGVERIFVDKAPGTDPIDGAINMAVADVGKLLTSISSALRGALPGEGDKLPDLRAQALALHSTLASIRAANVLERRRIDLLSALLHAVEATLRTYAALATGQRENDPPGYPAPVYAVDQRYAVAAALRAGSVLLLAGAIWIATGWENGRLCAAFTAITIALFAVRPDPRHAGIHFLASGAVGASVAFLFYVTIARHLSSHTLGIVLMEGIIVFLAIVIASGLSNRFWASGFCMAFFAMSDPAAIAHSSVAAVSGHVLGVVSGCALAVLAFHLVPSRRLENRWRKQSLKQMVGAIRTLIPSRVGPYGAPTHHAWQTRSIDTLMRIALPAASEAEVSECMSWIEVGVELLRIQDTLRADGELLSPAAKKTTDALLADLRDREPQTWYPRLIAADAELQDETLLADQTVLSIRARVLELASLLKSITAARHDTDRAAQQPSERSKAMKEAGWAT